MQLVFLFLMLYVTQGYGAIVASIKPMFRQEDIAFSRDHDKYRGCGKN